MYRTILAALVGVLLAVPGSVFAQETGTIAGTVVDSTTSESLPGVNVVVQALNRGAATRSDGSFRITGIPAGEYVLNVSFVGYQQKRRTVQVEANSTTNLRIQLATETVGIDNVVVTALGVEREERAVTTSVQQVGGAELDATNSENFINSLKGKIAGASIRSSSTMGGSSNIILRGYSSISGDNQPLIVIDGVVVSNRSRQTGDGTVEGNGGFDFGNAAQSLNPNNIKSVSVLKGPSAAALYGSRGANGVIQITTKSGANLEGELGVSFSSSVSLSQPYEFMDYQNQYGGGPPGSTFSTLDGDYKQQSESDHYVAQYAVDESWGPRLDGRPVRQWYSWDNVNGLEGEATPWVAHPDAVKDFLRTGTVYTNNIALSQQTDFLNYRLSLNTRNQGGVMPNGSMDRYQVNFNGSADLSEELRATAFAKYSYTNVKGRSGMGYGFEENPFAAFNTFTQRQLNYGPDSYMRDYQRPNGQQRGWNYAGVSGAQGPVTQFQYTDNPYVNRYENFQQDDEQRLIGKAEVAYDIIQDLTGTFAVSTDYRSHRFGDRRSGISTGAPAGYSEDIIEEQETSSELRFDYSGTLTESIDFSSFVAGKVRYSTYEENESSTNNGLAAPGVYTVGNSVGRPTVDDYFEEQMVYSTYGLVSLGYNDMVYLEGTLRNDWSSTLPADNNSYLYPSISANFIFTSLDALQGQDILSFGKVRASWAQVGQDTSPYRLGLTYPGNVPFQGQPLQQLQRSANNPELERELTTGIEFGANLRFFNDRVNLNTTYYRDVTRDQILAVDVSSASGLNSSLLNAGKVVNRGLEASLTVTPVLTEGFQWDVTANFNKNVNTVEELAAGLRTYTISDGGVVFGPEVQAREGAEFGALVQPALRRDKDGDIVFNRDGIPLTTSQPQVLGSYVPDWKGGLSTTLSYKGITLSALIDGQMGGEIYSLSNKFGTYSGLLESTIADNQRETGVIPEGVVLPEGTDPSNASQVQGIDFGEAVGRIPAASYWKNWFAAGGGDRFIYDATYAKLQEVVLTYSLPQSWFNEFALRRASVSVTGSNLMFLYKKAPNVDPSVTLGSGNIQGVEAANIPPQRQFTFRVNLNF
ncbi:SusC/RagA family TonB-linked outer membrane protein [Salinibacter sp. 10B]|uniref:SusC/RagA family TonB-linked outer membrane protein n=1 Tax=Salinibacter sp. 10B TaxID=1923971 RepID=UPI000CF401EA|nr:SusC/RagA family TonB-linked outer membrane protein [Salinibacter sp. 10B]PQJ33596.1 SusC/RagA family TonB-linked outer membrane protein [Salinibacter sp. 10B]